MTITEIAVLSNNTQTLIFKIDGRYCLHSLDYPCNNPLELEDVEFKDITKEQLYLMLISDLKGFFNEEYFETFQEDYKSWKAFQDEAKSVSHDVFETLSQILKP
jgi:hypothetical protein